MDFLEDTDVESLKGFCNELVEFLNGEFSQSIGEITRPSSRETELAWRDVGLVLHSPLEGITDDDVTKLKRAAKLLSDLPGISKEKRDALLLLDLEAEEIVAKHRNGVELREDCIKVEENKERLLYGLAAKAKSLCSAQREQVHLSQDLEDLGKEMARIQNKMDLTRSALEQSKAKTVESAKQASDMRTEFSELSSRKHITKLDLKRSEDMIEVSKQMWRDYEQVIFEAQEK